MKWTNYHLHCHYCDGKESIESHILQAIGHNVISLGFSSHCPVGFENVWSMKKEDLPDYLCEINNLKKKYANQIQVYKGLEIDFIPGLIGPKDRWINELRLDYTIGSVHFVGSYENGIAWEIDGRHSVFLDGLDKIYNGDIEYVVKKYFELTRQMIREACPDIVGHMDKIKMQNHGLWNEKDTWCREEVLSTLEEIRSTNAIIEVNTRGIYKKLTSHTYPDPWILKCICDMDIPIHINSDAHTPREMVNNFEDTAKLLQQTGFKKFTILIDGEWQRIPFTSNGLILTN